MCGIDVSTYQKKIDWKIVESTSSIQFAYIRATCGLTADTTFGDNWANCGETKILRGAYHFYKANVDPIAQADAFFKTVGELTPQDLPPVIDFEVKRTTGTGLQFVADIVAFMKRCEELFKRQMVVYTGGPLFDGEMKEATVDDIEYISSHDLWLSAYVTKPEQFVPLAWKHRNKTWTIWQKSGDVAALGAPGARVRGVPTVVDFNVAQVPNDDLGEWVKTSFIVQEEEPVVEQPVVNDPPLDDGIVHDPVIEDNVDVITPNPVMAAGFFKIFMQILTFVFSLIFSRRAQ